MKTLKKRFRGLYWRQLFVTAGMVMLTLFLLGASFFSLSYNYARSQKSEELGEKAQMVAQIAAGYLRTGQEDDLRQLATFAATVSEVDFLICDTEGHVGLSTDPAMEGLVVTVPEEMTREVLEDQISANRSDLGGFYEAKRFIVGVPIYTDDSGEPAGIAFAVSTSESLDSMWQGFIGLFFMTAFVVLMISFMASSVTAMRQVQPIREMAQATRRYAEGDFDVRMRDYGRDDEVGELAASFNNMAETLQQTERQRREFIANISHELKTPMTTIAGYTDGILDGTIPPEKERESLQVISSETRRLSRLVRRMLELSRLQSSERVAAQEQFDVAEVLLRVLVSLESKITEKDLDVQTQLPDGPVMVWGDPDAVTQVCYNLLDNAVKFSSPQGRLTLRITTKAGKAYIAIGNQGETIPPQQLTHIFDRFHKADSSRSTHKDGVGLGLYIVKTILNTYKEDITVTSQDGFTEFTFTLSEV